MLKHVMIFSSLIALLWIGSSFKAAHSSYWEYLGCSTVNYKLDRDVVKVTAKKGVFKKLKVKVTGGSINIHKMVVEYGNSKKEEISLRHHFNRSASTRVIDLIVNHRVIRDITFIYDTKNRSRRRGKVHIYGKH
ncbi:uncharacterized protein DUF2541 [Aquimarina brevivitae]|uniref:Uncharacterized protein DUF2541 n=2 Tax=Aquimarina brevivitae TaxID=323412 RepID=A0A4Q7P1Q2_9FLAO|nr:uncharacterized protein DUF2541 [Aquimarina brevivitae]